MSNLADAHALVERVDAKIDELNAKVAQFDSAVQTGARAAAEFFGDLWAAIQPYLVALKRHFDNAVASFKADIARYRAGVEGVFLTSEYDDKWLEIMRLANGVANDLKEPKIRPGRVGQKWEGTAAEAYFGAMEPQVAAAARIGSMAEKTSTTLGTMHIAGVVFLGAVAVALTVAIGGILAVIVSVPTGPGVVAGLKVALVAVLGAATTLIVAFVGFLAAQNAAAATMTAEAGNPLGFGGPGGTWPKIAPLSTDVTASDGDPADWRPKKP
jgi:hypothetical protein